MKDDLVCPVCRDGKAEALRPARGDIISVRCRRCGNYKISNECWDVLHDPDPQSGPLNSDLKTASAGHWLRARQIAGNVPLLTSIIVGRLADSPWLPSLQGQRENLIRVIGERAGVQGVATIVDAVRDQFAVGATSPSAVEAVLQELSQEALIQCDSLGEPGVYSASLTAEGWRRLTRIVG